ncbi:MAG: SDR family NAD(P)-dependent oxidoreductase [Solirubrobacterales bacterium]
MLSVSLSPDKLPPYTEPLGERVSLAAVNGPASLVLSGDPEALEEVLKACEADEIRAQRIAVDYAAHSAQIEALEEELLEAFAPISPQSSQIPMHSTVSGEAIDTAEMGPQYWYRNLRQTVLLEPVLRKLLDSGKRAFVEIGPHPVLAFGTEETFEDVLEDPSEAVLLPTLKREEGGPERFALSLAQAHTAGVLVDWGAYFKGTGAKRVPLPTYPFQRRRYWLPAGATAAVDLTAAGQASADHPLLGAAVELAGEEEGLLLTGRISLSTHPWLADHAVGGTVIFPGTGFLELALRAGEQAGAETIEELTMQAPLVLPEGGAIALQVSVSGPGEEGRREIAIHSRVEGEEAEAAGASQWTCHAQGALSSRTLSPPERIDAWPPEGAEAVGTTDFYENLIAFGFEYGPAFQGLTAAWRDGERIYAEVSLPEESAHEAQGFGIHPALLDSALQAAMLATAGEGVRLPFSWREVSLAATGAAELRVSLAFDGEIATLQTVDGAGMPVATVGSLIVRPLDTAVLAGGEPQAEGLLGLEWAEVALPDLDTPSAEVELMRCGSRDDNSAAEAARKAVQEALEAVQTWLADESKAGSRLALITEDAMAVAVGESPDPATAAIWGLIRSAQSEHPGRFALIDTDGTDASQAALSAALAHGMQEPQLALRDGVALAPRIGRVTAEGDDRDVIEAIDPERTVLITGATGSLGALTARHFAERHGARHLLLVSRSGSEAPGAKELQARLAELGAEATIVACDVANRHSLADVIAAVPAEHPVGAVIHCAGALADGTVETLVPEQIGRVFAPKVDAAWNLHELTRDLDLSVFVLFSSAAGALGGPGQGNYAAANVFLDALAEKRRADGLAASSIAWGLWEQRSDLTSRLSEADLARMRRGGFGALTDEQGLALLDAALVSARPATLAVPLHLPGLKALASTGALPPIFSGLVRVPRRRSAAVGSLAAKLSSLSKAERESHLLDLVRAEAAAVLGHDSAEAVEPDRLFRELGFDSLGAVELRNRLNGMSGLNLPATAVFDHPTAAELAAHLLSAMATGDAVSQPTSTFRWLIQEAKGEKKFDQALDLIDRGAELRATFDTVLAAEELPAPVTLADGPEEPALIMLPTVVTGSAGEFAGFAQQFRGERPVLSFSLPGYVEGELLPYNVQVGAETLAESILRLELDSDLVLVAHSSGGWLAHATASQLEARGGPPLALVMIDVFFEAVGSFLHFSPEFMAEMWTGDGALVPFDDARLTAMQSYGRIFAEWEPPEIETPIMKIRASDPPPGLKPEKHDEWSGAWPPSDPGIEVPGDHFSMMVVHAETTARAIRDALGLRAVDEQPKKG